MKTISYRKVEALETLPAEFSFTRSLLVQTCIKAFSCAFRPRCDLIHLNQHLRRDAGIDELELERLTIVRASLIQLMVSNHLHSYVEEWPLQ